MDSESTCMESSEKAKPNLEGDWKEWGGETQTVVAQEKGWRREKRIQGISISDNIVILDSKEERDMDNPNVEQLPGEKGF